MTVNPPAGSPPPSPRRPRRQYRPAAERRKEIVEATFQLLAEHGPKAWTVALLAERVGVSEATLFKHFASKDEILVAAVAEQVERTRVWMEAFEPPEDGWEGVRSFLEAFLAYAAAAGGGPVTLVEQAARFPGSLQASFDQFRTRAMERMAGWLKGSPLEPVSEEIQGIGLAVAVRALLLWMKSDGSPEPLQQASDQLALLGRLFHSADPDILAGR